ncbi:hypothetical protein Y600_390 [Burkholderia pseudomallei MSHR3709]|nr:hypothetical protein Y600_390 [Burkholderia pseudomallei MSHR3709]
MIGREPHPFAREQDRRRRVIERGRRLPHERIVARSRDVRDRIARAIERAAQPRGARARQPRRVERAEQERAQRRERPFALDRPRDVERDDVARALPDRAEMCIAQHARIAPLLDVAGAAAHLHRIAGNAARIAARAELDERRQDPHAAACLRVARVRLREQQRDLHEQRARLLGRHEHLDELPLHQRHVDQLAAERFAMARDVQRLRRRAPHQPRCAHAVRQTRHVDHVGHLMKAAADLADQIGFGAVERDLAARHRTAAELVLQAYDPIAIARAVGERLRQQEQREALHAVGRAFGPGEHHREIGVRVRAEPLVAEQPPCRRTVGGRAAHRTRRDAADVGARRLLGHEHRALIQHVEIARREPRQETLDELARTEAAQRARERIGHADGAAKAELGLHEQERQRVFDERRRRAVAMAHRGEPELRICDALELDVVRMLVDRLERLAAPRARLKHGRVPVGARREAVELVRRAQPERAQFRLEAAKARFAQMEPQQRRAIGIAREEVDAPRIGDVGCARRGRVCFDGFLHHVHRLSPGPTSVEPRSIIVQYRIYPVR